MIKALEKLRVQQRLTRSSLITVAIASIASVITAIFLFYISGQYNHVLTYYAFPQGDLGIAMQQLAPAYKSTRDAFQGFMDANIALGDQSHSFLNTLKVILLLVTLVLVVLACVVAVKIGAKIALGISQPLDQLVKRLQTFAQGDLKTPFPAYQNDDEVGDILHAVSYTTTKLSTILSDLENMLGHMANGNFDIDTSCEQEYVGDYQPILVAMRQMNNQMDEILKEISTASEMVSAGANNLAEAS